MPATRPSKRSTLHLLLPSSLPSTSATSSSLAQPAPPTSPSSPALPTTKRPSKRVLALAREMAAERGQLLLDPVGPFGVGGGKRAGGLVGELSEGKSMKGAREWNGLLCWARKGRGARWDASTQMYHVDYLSPEYYDPSLVVPVPLLSIESPAPPPGGKVSKKEAPSAPPPAVPAPTTTVPSAPAEPQESSRPSVGGGRRTRAGRGDY